MSAVSTRPPGLKGSPVLGSIMDFYRDPNRFLEQNAALGDVTCSTMMGLPVYQLVHPDDVRALLIDASGAFVKGMALRGFRPLVGQGLLLNEGESHRRQRRLMQPSFHRDPVARYAEVMLDEVSRLEAGWTDGAQVDMAEQMNQLALRIAARTLFGADVAEGEIAAVRDAMSAFAQWYHQSTHPLGALLQLLPSQTNRRFKQGRADLMALIDRMIAARRAGERGADILSRLLAARDDQGDGGGMSEELLRDEAITLLVAGHETTAATLAWAWMLLAEHPAVADRLAAEVEAAAPERAITAADRPKLSYAEWVFGETLRLYPSANAIPRQAAQDAEIGGWRIPKGALVMAAAWCTQRDPRWWPDPLRFDPERWTPEAKASRPKQAFYAFSSGARTCLGEGFAWVEGTLVLAALGRRWRASLPEGHKVELDMDFTLRPRGGLPMTLHRR